VLVHTIHCHFCGGVVRDTATIQYQPPRASAQFALPRESTCDCTPPIVYEDSPLDHPAADDEHVGHVEQVKQVKQVEHIERVERHEPDASALRPDPSDPWKGAA
jgi:hypothetical protein